LKRICALDVILPSLVYLRELNAKINKIKCFGF
jgi:hypothetical protein